MLSYRRPQTVDLFIALILILIINPGSQLWGQDQETEPVSAVTADTTDTLYTSVWPSLIRSALIPGLGQLHQEKPGKAIMFYGATLALLYNTIDNYRKYKNYDDRNARHAAYTSLAAFSQVYLANLLDVIDTHNRKNYRKWPEDLYADIPMRSPWGAAARTAMIPGWGQIYNEEYIKSVIAFGGFAFFATQVYRYNQEYQKTGDKYYWDKRVVNSWYLGLTYLVIILDAYVDAYLFHFDDAMGITMQVLPEDHTISVHMGVSFVF